MSFFQFSLTKIKKNAKILTFLKSAQFFENDWYQNFALILNFSFSYFCLDNDHYLTNIFEKVKIFKSAKFWYISFSESCAEFKNAKIFAFILISGKQI